MQPFPLLCLIQYISFKCFKLHYVWGIELKIGFKVNINNAVIL